MIPCARLMLSIPALALAADLRAATVRKVDFNHDVQPLLSDNCFACHGPDTTKIKGGLRLDLRDAAVVDRELHAAEAHRANSAANDFDPGF